MLGLLKSEPGIRLACFLGVLAAMAVWEILAPRRGLTVGKPLRWLSNLGLVTINSAAVRLVAPLGVTGVGVLATSRGWGLFRHGSKTGTGTSQRCVFLVVVDDWLGASPRF